MLLWQVYLEQCCNVLDMHEMLRNDSARLQQLTCGLALADSRGLALKWKDVGGSRLVKAASQADVRLMLQLLICSQVSTNCKLYLQRDFSKLEDNASRCTRRIA